MEYFIGALKKYADFNGRATRKEFWMFFLIYIVIGIILNVVDALTGVPLFSVLYALALFIPSISIGARRLHDVSRSGWWQLLLLIPLIGFIVLVVFWIQDSHEENKFGANPKFVNG